MDQYVNFDMVIDRESDGFVARVIDSPAGEASNAFSFPFSKLELENFLLRVGQSRRSMRRIDSPQMEAARQFGTKLYDSVFAGEVRTCFRRALDEADRQNTGMRVRLRFEDALDMADLPWEYLYSSGLNRFVGLSTQTPLVRYIDLPTRIRPLQVTTPLRILVMVSSPTDYLELNVDKEYDRLEAAVGHLIESGHVELVRVDDASLSELQQRLRRNVYHIFHFIGHGGFDEARDDGVLMLEDEQGRGRPVSGHELGTILHDHRTLRLAVLNSCEGARTSTSDPFAGAAQSLVQQGIPAVIAMQFEISDDQAIVFAQEFYSAIADGYPVDAAATEARKAMFTHNTSVEFGTPVLNMRAPDGMIFELTAPPVPPKPPALPKLDEPDDQPTEEPTEEPTDPEPIDEELVEPAETPAVEAAGSETESPMRTVEELEPVETPSPPVGMPQMQPFAAAPVEARTGLQPQMQPMAHPDELPFSQPEPFGSRSEKRKMSAVAGAVAGVVGVIIFLIVLGIWLGDDPVDTTTPDAGPPVTEAQFVEPDVTAAAEVVAPVVGTVFRPGPEVQVERVRSYDEVGWPSWEGDPLDLQETPFVVFEVKEWDKVQDHKTVWRLGWDDEFFYALVLVSDDIYAQFESGNRTFMGDSLNLDFDTDLEGDADQVGPDGDDFQLLASLGNLNQFPELWLFTGDGKIFRDAPGGTFGAIDWVDLSPSQNELQYAINVAVPWADLGVAPRAGFTMGFRASATDNDFDFSIQEVMYSNAADSTLFDVTTWGTAVLKP